MRFAGENPGRRLAVAAGLGAGATLALAGSAEAAQFTVNNLNNAGAGSLRQAMTDLNSSGAPGTITFASGLAGTINVTSPGLPTVDEPATIQGPGSNVLAIDGGGQQTLANPGRVVLTFSNSSSPTSVSGLTVENAVGLEGGITSGGDLTVNDVTVKGCLGLLSGGIGAGTAHVRSSTISGNVGERGGGIYAGSGEVTGSTINGNLASNFYSGTIAPSGGGIAFASPPTGALRIERSTIANNTVTNLNPSSSSNPKDATGGGIQAAVPGLTLNGATVSGNRVTTTDPAAPRRGGGLFSAGAAPPPAVTDSIISGNGATSGPDIYGPVNAGFDLIGSSSGATITATVPNSNLTGADPQLGPLAANGGPTQTMAIAPGSPALDAGISAGLTSDQRGLARPLDFLQFPNSSAAGADGSDIGAFELQPAAGPIKFKTLKRKRKNGTAKQSVQLPTPDLGQVKITGKGLKTKKILASTLNGLVKLPLNPKGSLRRKLQRAGKAKVKATVTYTPQGGTAVKASKKIKLLRKS